MKKSTLLLIVMCLGLTTAIIAQELELDPNQFINAQITPAHSVYKLKRSTVYAMDGRLDIDFKCEIVGPDNGPMVQDKAAGHPPVIVQTPDPTTGSARDMFSILPGGELILKNFILSGMVSTGNRVSIMTLNNGGKRYEAGNMVFCDFKDRGFRSVAKGIDVSIKDCVFLNGGMGDYSAWDGISTRFEASGNSFVLENNTLINTGRMMCNAGPFLKMKTKVLHNTFINIPKNAHEMRHYEFLSANNIWYNWEFVGYGPKQIRENDWYQMNFTTFNNYLADKLDSVSCYLGQSAFIIEDKINAWFATKTPQDSIRQSGYWEHKDVIDWVTNDKDYKIGTNYEGINPGFTKPATNQDDLVAYIDAYWKPAAQQRNPVPSYSVPLVVEFNKDGVPVCNWPLQFDLSYANETLKKGGSDGLPLGDLNWFPDAKATYLAQRDQFIAALKDSMLNAKAIYRPPARTPFITPTTSVDSKNMANPVEFCLAQNYPNPFNPETMISFTMVKAADVSLEVYNMLGQKVRTLVNEKKSAGSHQLIWNGKDNAGKQVGSGLYFYSLKSGSFKSIKKMLLAR